MKIREVKQYLTKLVKDDVVVRRLMSLEGIGQITAITMRAEIACFDRFDNGKQRYHQMQSEQLVAAM